MRPNAYPAPPNPQIAVGPDDILTIVNRVIARYPNPNAAGNTGATNPYVNPPTNQAMLDVWTGVNGGNLNNLCPTLPQFSTCVLDNASLRYDQLQGRFVVLMTVTDLESHQSNWVLVVSRWANFACSTTGGGPASACPFTSDLFTPPIVQNFGGPNIGGFNSNWVAYVIPINVIIGPSGVPANNITAGTPFCVPGQPAAGATGPTGSVPLLFGGVPTSAPPGGGTAAYNTGPGNPPLTQTSGCTNYYPTGARFGLDNDNIILTAPVLDQTQTVFPAAGGAGLPGGAYAGTRVTTVPKLIVYNGTSLPLTGGTPFVTLLTTGFGVGIGAVNLADDIFTGTLVGASGGISGALNPIPGVVGPTQAPSFFGGYESQNGFPPPGAISNVLPIFWEPDNVRGRALASFDSQVGVSSPADPIKINVQGVITPLDYLVGSQVAGLPGGVTISPQTVFYVQPIVFSCPATAIFNGPAGVTFCGTAGGAGTQVPDVPTLGVLNTAVVAAPNPAPTGAQSFPRTSANSLVLYGDPQLVGQGPVTPNGPASLVGPSGLLGFAATGGQPRLYVGDSRPQQVMFREGLLYVARTAMTMDLSFNALNTSTVVYDILKQAGPACQAAVGAGLGLGGPGPFCNPAAAFGAMCANPTTAGCAASAYSPIGITIPNPVTILETQWYNGTTPKPCPAVAVSGPVSGAGNTPGPGVPGSTGNPSEPLCDANGFGFYAPMFESPANVTGGLATSSNQPISPISLFPWLEKLFVGMTTGGTPNLAGTFSTNNPSLWDFRPGDDAYDSSLQWVDPVDGQHKVTTNNPFFCNEVANPLTEAIARFNGGGAPNPGAFSGLATCPVIPFGIRGGASTDPNDGSLWLYGTFAKKRLSQLNGGPGAWGTSVANYALDFPATDPYNNDNSYFSDVAPGTNGFFIWIQIAKNVGIAVAKSTGTAFCPGNPGGNPPIIPPPTGNAGGGTTPAPGQNCNIFGPTDFVQRNEMAKWIVLAQMDEAQVTAYLLATGGLPGCADLKTAGLVGTGLTVSTCGNGSNVTGSSKASSFADPPQAASGTTPAYSGIFDDPFLRYIETMYRRGYTKGCVNTQDTTRTYCPTALVTRGQMAVFVIRAKMNNVFPTTLSGIPLQGIYGDNFGTFLGINPNGVAVGPNGTFANGQYFQDEPASDGFFLYIQKMRELRITNGTGLTATCTTGPCYSPNVNITRQELATFIIRAFFL